MFLGNSFLQQVTTVLLPLLCRTLHGANGTIPHPVPVVDCFRLTLFLDTENPTGERWKGLDTEVYKPLSLRIKMEMVVHRMRVLTSGVQWLSLGCPV